jgi:IMP dehydrogenase/GMP reductase
MIFSKLNKVGYELSEVNIVQDAISYIDHRAECNPYVNIGGKEYYPVIVAPMGAVTNEKNYKVWLDEKFMCVVPRTVNIKDRLNIMYETFSSFSLNEAEEILTKVELGEKTVYVCIDIAQGTMNRLYKICKTLKRKYGNQMIIMTGNVANPDAYMYYADAGIDYMRLSIGSGSRCTTSCNVGIHYPMATLIDETRMKRERWEELHEKKAPTKIVVDGGISHFDEIQKCLALGADLVMSGNIFARAWEACGNVVYLQPNNLNMNDAIPYNVYMEKTKNLSDLLMEYYKEYDRYKYDIAEIKESLTKLEKRMPYREYYGMSTKRAQKETGGNGTTTSEGISRPIPVEYNIAKWADNMKSYLISVMSYTNSRNLEDLAKNTELVINLSGDKSFRK